MSSVTHPQSEQPSDHDELVAYLDGELGPEECRAVEERLAGDADYRQHLRDLDQAWEALGALPATAVDDGFARTTIELACVAAEEDLSQRTSLAAVENRGRRRWWIAASVAAAVIGFVMVRALAAHRNNLLLADLPVITQVNALGLAPDVEFLRTLSASGFDKEAVKDDPAFERELVDFRRANATSLDDRRRWVDSLTPEQKADLAERTRAFVEQHQKREEKDRLRNLAEEISQSPDKAALEATLVAYGQWLSRQLSPGEQEKLRIDLPNLSASQQVAAIQTMAEQKKQQTPYHLSLEEKEALRHEIIALAKERKEELLANQPAGQASDIAGIDPNDKKAALFFILREAPPSREYGDAVVNRLMDKLSPAANEHFNRIPRWRYDRRRGQLLAWIHEAVQAKPTVDELERYFASDKVTFDQRQKLLDMPKSEMDVALEKLYLRSELGIDERLPLFREFGDGGRGPRGGPRDGGRPDGRRGESPPRGPDGPPSNDRFGPDDRPPEFDPDRPRLGPGGRPGMRPEEGPDGGRRRRPSEQSPPDGPPN